MSNTTPASPAATPDLNQLLAKGLRPNSKFAIDSAIGLLNLKAVGGWLIAKIPDKDDAPVDFTIITGRNFDFRATPAA